MPRSQFQVVSILAGDGCGQKLFYSGKRGALNVDQACEAPMREGEREGMVLPYKYSIPMRPLKENKCVPTRRKDSHSNANSREGVVKSNGSKERGGNLLSWGYSTLGILIQHEAFFLASQHFANPSWRDHAEFK